MRGRVSPRSRNSPKGSGGASHGIECDTSVASEAITPDCVGCLPVNTRPWSDERVIRDYLVRDADMICGYGRNGAGGHTPPGGVLDTASGQPVKF